MARSGKHMKHSGKKHLPKRGAKEQRMYEHIRQSAKRSGRCQGREKEVAARTVNKYHRQHGHRKGE
jgi:hypothetical protein